MGDRILLIQVRMERVWFIEKKDKDVSRNRFQIGTIQLGFILSRCVEAKQTLPIIVSFWKKQRQGN
jgi:hypothetical protein